MMQKWPLRYLLAIFVALSVLLVTNACTQKKMSRDKEHRTLQLVTTAKLKGLDPIYSSDVYSATEVNRLYEGLFQYHYLKRPYVLEPLLAQEMPQRLKGGLGYKIKIRKGVKFHDHPVFPNGKGREVVASDFVYSLLRLADPQLKSTGWWTLKGRIKGLDEWRDAAEKQGKANYDAKLAGLEVMDMHTLIIRLNVPYPQFINVLAMPFAAVVAREVVEKYGKEFINHAVGTGPFILEEFRPNEVVKYKKNPNYRDLRYPSEGEKGDKEKGLLADAGKRLPLVDRVEVKVILESQTQWMNFLKGNVDLLGGVPKDEFKEVVDPSNELTQKYKDKGIRMLRIPSLDLTYIAFNLESSSIPQFKDIRVRRAIALAFSSNDKKFMELFFNNMAIPAQAPVPPGLAGHLTGYKNPYRAEDKLDLAKRLLAEAGYPNGKGFPIIPYDSLSYTTSRQMAELQAKSFAKIGLKLKIISNTWPRLQTRIQQRQAQLWGIAWGADYPDAESFLQLYYGPNAQPGGMNSSYFKNKEFDALFEKARVMDDSPERTRIYKRLGKLVAEEMPVIWGYHRIGRPLLHSWLKNYKYSQFPINQAKYLNLDMEEKIKRLQR